MGIFELVILSVGLAMDAFTVAICKGLSFQRVTLKNGVTAGLWFGGFQAIMPFLGYLIGTQFERYIASFDHWIAFGLLAVLGLNMIRAALQKEAEECELPAPSLSAKEMLPLAVATSVDALAVGITFAVLRVAILPAVTLIGAVTFSISALGLWLGNMFGRRFKKPAELLGGVVLILLGLNILREHLGGPRF